MAEHRSTTPTVALTGREESSVQEGESSSMLDMQSTASKIETELKTEALEGACSHGSLFVSFLHSTSIYGVPAMCQVSFYELGIHQ